MQFSHIKASFTHGAPRAFISAPILTVCGIYTTHVSSTVLHIRSFYEIKYYKILTQLTVTQARSIIITNLQNYICNNSQWHTIFNPQISFSLLHSRNVVSVIVQRITKFHLLNQSHDMHSFRVTLCIQTTKFVLAPHNHKPLTESFIQTTKVCTFKCAEFLCICMMLLLTLSNCRTSPAMFLG